MLENADKSSYEISINDRSYLVDVRVFQENGIDWRIYVVLASDDFLGGLQNSVYRTGLITLLAAIIAFFIAILTSGWITRPILRLNLAARELAEGRLTPVPDTQRKDELGQLSRSFNKMARELNDLVINLESRVATRTQELAEKRMKNNDFARYCTLN